MGLLTKFLRWVLRALMLFSSVAPVLWGATVYSGIAFSLYVIVDQTSRLVSGFSSLFASWADGLNVGIVELFSSANQYSFFQFFCYVCALDVPFEWFRTMSVGFVRYFLTYTCGLILGTVEICVLVLGIYWVRKRLKSMSAGLGSDGGVPS